MFLRGIITTRDNGGSVEERLSKMKLKSRGNQSQLTAARDLRKMFELFGFIEKLNGKYLLTERGRVISQQTGSSVTTQEKKAWYEGLVALSLSVGNKNFRPIKIMLELLYERPLETRLLVFIFIAQDNSIMEINRIKRIVTNIAQHLSSFEEELMTQGISESNARNAVKILPAIAEQVRLIRRTDGIAYITPFGRTVSQLNAQDAKNIVMPGSNRKRPFYRIIEKGDDLRHIWEKLDIEDVDFDERGASNRQELIRNRTDIHQQTLKKIVDFLSPSWTIGVGNFDLLAIKGSHALLVEVKSLLPNDVSDERLRIIEGVGELLFYESFDVPELIKNTETHVQKIMLFSHKPNDNRHINFLVSHGIWVLWVEGNSITGEENSISSFNSLNSN